MHDELVLHNCLLCLICCLLALFLFTLANNLKISKPYSQVCSICTAHIRGEDREPLRIAVLSKRWESSRMPTPQFMGVWTCNEDKGAQHTIPVLLGNKYENVVVWSPGNLNKQQQREMFVEPGEVRFSRVFAMSGNGRDSSASPCIEPDV